MIGLQDLLRSLPFSREAQWLLHICSVSRALADTSANRLSPTQLNQLTAAYVSLLKAQRDDAVSTGPFSRLRALALRLWSAADSAYSMRVAPESLQNRLHMICQVGASVERDTQLIVDVATHLLHKSKSDTVQSESKEERAVTSLVNAVTVEGFTPLMYAAASGHSDLVLFLISQRASIGACSHERRLTLSPSTALQFAAKNGLVIFF
jgi:hypothetical protein